MAIEFTEEEIEQLRKAIVSGVLEVEYDGPPKRRVRYQSLAEMRDLLASMDSSSGGRVRYRLVKVNRGV